MAWPASVVTAPETPTEGMAILRMALLPVSTTKSAVEFTSETTPHGELKLAASAVALLAKPATPGCWPP